MDLLAALKTKIESFALPPPARRGFIVVTTLSQDFVRCDLLKQASAMAYVTLLSLVPSLVAIFCVLSLFSPLLGKNSQLITQARAFILDNLAASSGESVVTHLDRLIASLNLAKIGWSAFASVLITLILLLRQIEEALNRIWLVQKGRNAFRRFMYFWTFLTFGVVVLAIAIGMSSGFNFGKFFSIQAEIKSASSIASSISSWMGGFLFFLFLYKVVPNCYVRTRDAIIGALAASILLTLGGHFYAQFAKNAVNYQTLYGALAQLPIFLMWLYLNWVIILLGALISWRTQQGFPVEEKGKEISREIAPTERLRNLQVKNVLPLMTLLAIFQKFQDGTGKGLSAQDLAMRLKLPLPWVSSALESLSAFGYIINGRASEAGLDSETSPDLDPYFPAFPATSLKLSDIRAKLASPILEWLDSWHPDFPQEFVKLLTQIAAPQYSHPELSLADLLLAKS